MLIYRSTCRRRQREARRGRTPRSGVAAVEFAVLLPLLAFLFVVAIDWAQVYYYAQTVENCARNGAVFGSKVFNSTKWQGETSSTYYDSVKKAALADGQSLNPALTEDDVTVTTGTDSESHPYVQVKVDYTYTLFTNFSTSLFNVGHTVNLSRTVRMRVAQDFPNTN